MQAKGATEVRPGATTSVELQEALRSRRRSERGKDQVVAEAMAIGAPQVDEMIEDSFRRSRNAEGAVRRFFTHSAEMVAERDFEAGSPVALVALERAGGEDEIARLGRDTLQGWTDRFAAGLRADGVERRAARKLAAGIVNQYEGALILSRIRHEVEPLQTAGAVMQQIVRATR